VGWGVAFASLLEVKFASERKALEKGGGTGLSPGVVWQGGL
jgi:hypothetical protein